MENKNIYFGGGGLGESREKIIAKLVIEMCMVVP